jgi:hypothetical protein
MKVFRVVVAITCALALLGPCAAGAQGAGWATTQLPGPPGELFLLGVSCPTESFCVASGTQNLIAASTDPTGGPGAWATAYVGEGRFESPSGTPAISSRQIQGISCPTTKLCVAVTTLGQVYSSTDPTGPASAWNDTELKPTGTNIHLYGVSCPTESFCVTVSGRRVNAGKIFTSTNPTGGPGAWQETDLGEGFDFRAVSCSSPTFCVAAGANGELVASRNPGGGAGTWTTIGAPGGGGILQAIDCIVALCLAGNTGGNLLAASEPTQLSSWTETNGGSSVQITSAACASASACLAVDNNGDVTVSDEPLGPHPGWTSTTVRPYGPGAEEFASGEANGLFGASCPTTSFCTLVGSRGTILTSTDPFAAAATEPPKTRGADGGAPKKPQRGPKRPRAVIARLGFVGYPHADPNPRRATLKMRFYAAKGPVDHFECRLDTAPFRRCHSPEHIAKIGPGMHRISVRAVGSTGRHGRVASRRFFVGLYCPHKKGRCLGGVFEIPPH